MKTLALGNRRIDLDTARIDGHGGSNGLTPNEVRLLAMLLEADGGVVAREELLVGALGYAGHVRSRAVDKAIYRLRRKLEDDPADPRWLRSEEDGYRLVVPSVADAGAPGRQAELALVLDKLAQLDGEVAIVGPPGIGKSHLARAVLVVAPQAAGRLRVQASAPPGMPAVRLGGLPPDVAEAVMVARILAVRGEPSLSDAETEAVRAWVERTHGHPGALLDLAEQAAALALPAVAPTGLDEASRFLEALEPLALEGVCRRVLGDAPPAAAAAALHAGALQAHEVEGVRTLVVPFRLEAALLGPALSHPRIARAWVAAVRTHLAPALEQAIHAATEAADHQLDAAHGALQAALRVADEAELVALAPLVALSPRPPADPGLAERILRAKAVDDDGAAWRAMARVRLGVHADLGSTLSLRTSPEVSAHLLFWWVRALSRDEAPADAWHDVVALARQTRRSAPPGSLTAAMADFVLGRAGLVVEDLDVDIRQALTRSLAALRRLGAERWAGSVLMALMVLASQEGRPREAMAWASEVVAATAVSAEVRGSYCGALAQYHASLGEPDDAQVWLQRARELGTDPRLMRSAEGVVALLSDDLDRAWALLCQVVVDPYPSDANAASLHTAVAWLHLLRGDRLEAEAFRARLAETRLLPLEERCLRVALAVERGSGAVAALRDCRAEAHAEWPVLQILAVVVDPTPDPSDRLAAIARTARRDGLGGLLLPLVLRWAARRVG